MIIMTIPPQPLSGHSPVPTFVEEAAAALEEAAALEASGAAASIPVSVRKAAELCLCCGFPIV